MLQTTAPHGHVLTNVNVWSPDSTWVVYDVRSDPAGTAFDGTRIERVHAGTGAVQVLYESRRGACCGVATCHPTRDAVAFILGPEDPTPDWSYAASHRRGIIVEHGVTTGLDARDLTAPFTPGALRGGSHVHVFSPSGRRVSFTYEDAVTHPGRRGVGVTDLSRPVVVPDSHPRNHDGTGFSVVATALTDHPAPGSDQIDRAVEEGWVDDRTLAFQGRVTAADGTPHWEVFALHLPDDLTRPGTGPLQGTTTDWPAPPAGCVQRRLTFTRGLATTPRHWLRPSPDGRHVALLMADPAGVAQLFTVPVVGGTIRQVTRHPWPVASAFTWHPDGSAIAHVGDGSVCLTDVRTGTTRRLTPPAAGLRPEACVVSPDGARVAHARTDADGRTQVCVTPVGDGPQRPTSTSGVFAGG